MRALVNGIIAESHVLITIMLLLMTTCLQQIVKWLSNEKNRKEI